MHWDQGYVRFWNVCIYVLRYLGDRAQPKHKIHYIPYKSSTGYLPAVFNTKILVYLYFHGVT